MGDTMNAMRDYQAAIRLEPDYALAYYNAGNLYFKQRQFQQVWEHEIEIFSWLLFVAHFELYFDFGLFQALSYYEKASSWNPRDESAIGNAAITKVSPLKTGNIKRRKM